MLGVGVSVLAVVFTYQFEGYSRSVFVIEEFLRHSPDDFSRVVIYGAGDGGVLALREIVNNPALKRQARGFIDDDPSKQRTTI